MQTQSWNQARHQMLSGRVGPGRAGPGRAGRAYNRAFSSLNFSGKFK